MDHFATQTWTIQGSSTGTYGSLALTGNTGEWTYTLNNADTDTDALAEGESFSDTFTVRVADDKGAYVDTTVSVLVTGTNDSPVVTGTSTGSSVEAGNLDDGTVVAGDPDATGTLSATDVDHFATQTWTIQGSSTGTYGSLALTGNTGEWTYTLNNADTDTDALAEGESFSDTFTVRVADDKGAYVDTTVSVLVTGTNDSPVVTGTSTGQLGRSGQSR